MEIALHNPASVAAPSGRYSHVVEVTGAGRMLFVSGQVPVRPDGTVPDTLAGQADQVYANIVAVLADRGAPPSAIVKLTTYFVEAADPDDCVRKARARHLGEHRPASTAVRVAGLVDPAWLIEIDAIAMLP